MLLFRFKTKKFKSKHLLLDIKVTVKVISSDPPLIKWHVWFTQVPLKSLSDQALIEYPCFCFWNLVIFICGFSAKVTWTQWSSEKRRYLPQYWSDKRFKWHCCESGMPLFLNYDDKLFNWKKKLFPFLPFTAENLVLGY